MAVVNGYRTSANSRPQGRRRKPAPVVEHRRLVELARSQGLELVGTGHVHGRPDKTLYAVKSIGAEACNYKGLTLAGVRELLEDG